MYYLALCCQWGMKDQADVVRMLDYVAGIQELDHEEDSSRVCRAKFWARGKEGSGGLWS